MGDKVDYFGTENPIFADKELLQISHLPEDDARIIGRDEQLQNLGSALRPALTGNTPNNVFIYGKTGTGKSLCSKFITRRVIERAKQNGVRVGLAYVDCLQDSTETQAVQAVAEQLNDPELTGTTIPETGLATSVFYNRSWKAIDSKYDVAIVILDEVDKLGDDNILMQLSRANESGKLSSSKLATIGISNKIRYEEELNERVKSSLCERDYVFPPYDADQLREILTSRSDAFAEGVLDDSVVPKVSALAAREHGDARKAIDILRFAGEIAEDQGDERVRGSHVEKAQQREEQSRLSELIAQSPVHARFILLALAFRVQQEPNPNAEIPNTEIFETYRHLCEQEGSDPLKERRLRDILSELEFLSIIEQERRGRGRGKGGWNVNRLVDSPELVIKACQEAKNQ